MKKSILVLALSVLLVFIGCTKKDLESEGLMAFYPFNGNTNDESGNGNHGIVYEASLTTDRFGNSNNAYSFDGNDHIKCKYPAPKLKDDDFTIQFYVKTTSYSRMNGPCTYAGTRNPSWAVMVDNGKIDFFVRDDSLQTAERFGRKRVNDNKWHHITCMRKSNDFFIYIDGQLDAQKSFDSFGSVDSDTPLTIGMTEMFGQYFIGKMDEIRIYNRALSNSEILNLFNKKNR